MSHNKNQNQEQNQNNQNQENQNNQNLNDQPQAQKPKEPLTVRITKWGDNHPKVCAAGRAVWRVFGVAAKAAVVTATAVTALNALGGVRFSFDRGPECDDTEDTGVLPMEEPEMEEPVLEEPVTTDDAGDDSQF